MDPLIIFFGLCVGLLVGLTGVGGGSLMTPLLIIVFGINPVTAVGTDLFYAAVTKTVGGYKHLRQGTVDLRLSAWMAVGSVPASVGGVYVLKLLQHAYGSSFNTLMLVLVACALLITGIAVLGRALIAKRVSERDSARLERRDKIAAVAIGVFVGFVLGMTSAGSGALIAVGLILVFRLTPTRVVGTDVLHAAVLLWAASAAHLVAGDIDFGLAGTIVLGSVPGVWIGSHLSVRIPTGTLRTVLAVVLLGSGLGLLFKAGASIPPLALVGVPLIVIALLATQALTRRTRPTVSPVAPLPAPDPDAERSARQLRL